MYGRMSQDVNKEARGNPNDAPQSGYLVDPTFRKQTFLLEPMGTRKLNGLYNTMNMPVFYSSAGQRTAANRQFSGTQNRGLSQILFPNKMPYPVTPQETKK